MTLPTTRPSDEITKKIIAKIFGFDEVVSIAYDPRDCTDTALELLAYLNREYDVEISLDYIYKESSSAWEINNQTGNEYIGYQDNLQHIPISGPPFCYAVVHLAAKVLGEGEG